MIRRLPHVALGALLLLGASAEAGDRAPRRLSGGSIVPEAAPLPLPQASASPDVPTKVERIAPAFSVAPSAPLPIGIEADVYCSGYVGSASDTFAGRIISAEKVDNQKSFIEGDVVYLDVGVEQGVAAGQEFWVVRPSREVYRPNTADALLGLLYMTPARLRVLCSQDRTSLAEIVFSCDEVEIGDVIAPFEPIPIPLVRRSRPLSSCDPANGNPTGFIVESKDRVTPLAVDTIVYLDLGEDNGLAPGDYLTVYRPRSDDLPIRTVLGEVAVMTTRARTSVAKVMAMREMIYVGDQVEPK